MGIFDKISARVGRGPLPKAPNLTPEQRATNVIPVKGGRSSYPDTVSDPFGAKLSPNGRYRIVDRPFFREVIPLIRSLSMFNNDVSQAMWNIVSLGNTGHKVYFDRNVPEEQVSKMRAHIVNRRKEWMAGQPGRDGMVNKMFYQLLIGGALSNEWVPNNDLTGIDSVVLVNPEDVEWVLNPDNTTYIPYQRVRHSYVINTKKDEYGNMVKLNEKTFRYYALNGDTEKPYGIPIYIPCLPDIETQSKMKKNINYIVDQFGLIGFLSAAIGKPDQMVGESNEGYTQRLEGMLVQTKDRLKGGMADGVVVGFKEDSEFQTTTISKNYDQAIQLFKNNESQIASGVKQDPSLWGRDYNTSETQITVVFMKMISELRNFQNIIASNLEFGYTMELLMAGYKFEYLTVKFKPSTLGDDYKLQQAEEIKIRNAQAKYILGITSQEQMADELGYEAPDQLEPRVDVNTLAGGKSQQELEIASQKREAGKDASDKKARATKKPLSDIYVDENDEFLK